MTAVDLNTGVLTDEVVQADLNSYDDRTIAFSPDGRLLVTAVGDHVAGGTGVQRYWSGQADDKAAA